MKKLQRVADSEVISEFLKNEYYLQEFQQDREAFQRVVMHADLSSETENQIRRGLLFRRHGKKWRELPRDTQWWEVRIESGDLANLRVFPRGQWKKIANGELSLLPFVECIRSERYNIEKIRHVRRIRALSERLRVEDDASSVILIGVDEIHPLTILEGNHRLTAALLASPTVLENRFRVFCGFSPKMYKCLCYQTNLATLMHFAWSHIRSVGQKDLLPSLSGSEQSRGVGPWTTE
jgi:hypothetical protein